MSKTYTLGEVAVALGLPRPTLLSWAQRGYLRFLDDREPGVAREFSRDDVAYTAAFAVLARGGSSASDAAKIMECATGSQRSYWRDAIRKAISGAEVNVLAKRYAYKGVEEIEAELHCGSDLEGRRRALADGTREGAQIDAPNVDLTEAPPDVVVIYEIGAAIAKAIRHLS